MKEKHKETTMTVEKDVLFQMVKIYCNSFHGTKGKICNECKELYSYATKKLDTCIFGSRKPPCNKCNVHCYDRSHREQIRTVMKYAGPRMIFRHPVSAIRHILGMLKKPQKKV